jgi:tRNA A-37 threonylcarbamoyl transferase component Bud32
MAQTKLGQQIGIGTSAKIYQWGEDRALKLCEKVIPLKFVQAEFNSTQIAYKAGLPVPAVEEIILHNNCHGIIMSRIDGPLLTELIYSQPEKTVDYANILADLQFAVNSTPATGLGSLSKVLNKTIERLAIIPDTLKSSVLNILKELPDGETMCHFDYHASNIIMSSKGPFIIDWMGAMRGDPLADVARTWLGYTDYAVPSEIPTSETLKKTSGHFLSAYLERYFRQSDIPFETLELWKVPIIANRIFEVGFHDSAAEKQKKILSRLQKQLSLIQRSR